MTRCHQDNKKIDQLLTKSTKECFSVNITTKDLKMYLKWTDSVLLIEVFYFADTANDGDSNNSF